MSQAVTAGKHFYMTGPIDVRIHHFADGSCDAFPSVGEPGSALPTILRDLTARLYRGDADGVELKEWFTGPNRESWMAKSGQDALGAVAMPIHEAVIPWFYRAVDVTTNSVALGSRSLGIPAAAARGQLLLSFHRYRKGFQRQLVGPTWRASSRFLEDFAVMSCIDRIIGQTDRHAGNYMVLEDGTLFAVDNGRCLGDAFLAAPLATGILDELKRQGGREGHSWSTETQFVRARIAGLSDAYVEQVFDAIPRLWRRLHDAEVAHDPSRHFQSATLERKFAVIKGNLQILRDWLQGQ